jgi:hypothetical protein
LAKLSENIADVYGVPIELAVIPLLSAYATATGNKAMLDTVTFKDYPLFWFVIVAPSGTGKTKPLADAYRPISNHEEKERERFKERIEIWNAEIELAKQNNEPPPPKPKQKRLLANDTTPEALWGLLADNTTLTVYRDELFGHFADIGRYNRSGEVEHWLSSFNYESFSVDRRSSDISTFISKPILSMVGTIQPDKIYEVAKEKMLRGNGYFQRCLFAFPESVKSPKYSSKTVSRSLIEKYEKDINHLLNLTETTTFFLSDEAEKIYISFFNQMSDTADETPDDYLKALYSKMKIHAVRLALVLAVIDTIEDDSTQKEVSAEVMNYAIALCEYFITTGKKIHVPPQPQTLGKAELVKMIDRVYGINNQEQFAKSIGISGALVSKALKRKG